MRSWGAGGPGKWDQVTKLTANDGTEGDYFGVHADINGDITIVGAVFVDDDGSAFGSAYVFQRDAGGPNNWGWAAKLTPPTPIFLDNL